MSDSASVETAKMHRTAEENRPSTSVDATSSSPTKLPAEWHGKTLVVPDSELRDQVLRRSALSVSTAQNITGCQARYALDRLYQHTGEVPPDDLFAPNSIGTFAHEVLENFYRAEPAERTVKLAEQISVEVVSQAVRKNGIPAEQVAFADKLLKEVRDAYRGIFRFEDPKDVHIATVPVKGDDGSVTETLGLELPLWNLTIAGGVPLSGFVDRATAIEGDSKRIRVSDYKSTATKKRKTEKDRYFSYGDQLRIYAMGFEALTGIRPEEAEVIYSRQSRSKVMHAPVSVEPKALSKTASWFADTWQIHHDLADSGQYETSDSPLCGWCPFVHVCPSAAEKGHEAKNGQEVGQIADLPTLPPIIPVGSPKATAEGDTPRTLQQNTAQRGTPMSKATLFGRELKPWEDTSPGDKPNPAGYDSIGAFGLVSIAVEELHKAGIDLTGKRVKALSETFASIVADVQEEVAGSKNLGAGANTRLRGALRTSLATLPVPFGQDEDAWDKWAANLKRRTKSQATVAVHLLNDEIGDKPWRALAGNDGA